MDTARPVFLFTFANDAQASLRLAEEQNVCWEELKHLHRSGTIEVQNIGYATLEQVFSRLNQYRDQVYVFHYGGHSDAEGLNLPLKGGSARNLGMKIGQQKNLKLLFLNGCKNYHQVELLLEHGISAVIATTASVEDNRAIVLAQQFYQAFAAGHSIRAAFESARAFLLDGYPELANSYRDFGLPGEAVPDFAWGLYARDDAALDWTPASIRRDEPADLSATLREASRKRLRKFTSPGGRFFHLSIDEAILSDIEGLHYVQPDMIDNRMQVDGEAKTMRQCLPWLWRAECPHALLAGAGGMGKTVGLLQLWHELLERSPEEEVPVPIFIQLNEFNNEPGRDFIRNYIKSHFADVDVDVLAKSPRQTADNGVVPNLVLLLDGYNEVSTSSNELLLEINRLRVRENYPGLQIIVTARTDIRTALQWQIFHLLELSGLTDEQIQTYLSGEIPSDARLLDLLRNPMLLSIYAAQSELPRRYYHKGYLRADVSSTGELLYNVEAMQRVKIEKTHENAIAEIAFRRFVLEHWLPYLGWKMHQAGLFFIPKTAQSATAPDLRTLLSEALDELLTDAFYAAFDFFDRYLEEETWRTSSRHTFRRIVQDIAVDELAILVQEGDTFRFLHQNFRDYFAARHLQIQLQIHLPREERPELFSRAPLDPAVRQLLGELEGEHTNTLEWHPRDNTWRWKAGSFSLPNSLFRLLDHCRGTPDSPALGFTVWNLLHIWLALRGELSGADLSNLDLTTIAFNNIRLSRPGLYADLSHSRVTGQNFLPPGHKGYINCIALAAEERYLVSGCDDGKVRVWDIYSGQRVLGFSAHFSQIESLACDPVNARFATATKHQVKIWDLHSGRCLQTLDDSWLSNNQAVAFSPDGRYLAWVSKSYTTVWDFDKEEEILSTDPFSISFDLWHYSVAFSPDGSALATGYSDGTLAIWELPGAAPVSTQRLHRAAITSVAFHPTESKLLTASSDRTIKIWNLATGAVEGVFSGHTGTIHNACFIDGGNRIVSSSDDGTAMVWDTETGQALLTLRSDSMGIRRVVGNRQGTRIVTAGADKQLKIWEGETGACLVTIAAAQSEIDSIALSPDGRYLVSNSGDYTAKIWDVTTGVCQNVLWGHATRVQCVAYSPCGQFIATGSFDKTARLWEAESGRVLHILTDHPAEVSCVEFSPDGRYLLACCGGTRYSNLANITCRIYDTATGKKTGEFTGVGRRARFSPDSSAIAFTLHSRPEKLAVYDLAKGGVVFEAPLTEQSAVMCLAYSPDGRHIALGMGTSFAEILDTKTGASRQTIRGVFTAVRAVDFSPSGELLVTGTGSGEVKVWHWRTGQLLTTLQKSGGEINAILFSPGGQRVYAGCRNGKIEGWDIESGEAVLQLADMPGLLVSGVDFRNVDFPDEEPGKTLTSLARYGAILNTAP